MDARAVAVQNLQTGPPDVTSLTPNFFFVFCVGLMPVPSHGNLKFESFVASLSSPEFAGALKASTTSSSMRANKNNCAKFQGLQSHIQEAMKSSEVLLGIMTRWA